MAGTIINEQGIIYKTMRDVLHEKGYVITNKEMDGWHGKDKKEVLHRYLQQDHKYNLDKIVNYTEKDLINKLEERYFAENAIKLVDDNLYDFFDKLRMNDVKVALNTGYPRIFQKKIIDHFNLQEHIDGSISSEMVKKGRPYPYMIYNLMEELNIKNVKNVAKVGDTVNDMLEGVNAGCKLNIGVLTGADSKDKLKNYGTRVFRKITDL